VAVGGGNVGVGFPAKSELAGQVQDNVTITAINRIMKP
jgi:hypothetical protein